MALTFDRETLDDGFVISDAEIREATLEKQRIRSIRRCAKGGEPGEIVDEYASQPTTDEQLTHLGDIASSRCVGQEVIELNQESVIPVIAFAHPLVACAVEAS